MECLAVDFRCRIRWLLIFAMLPTAIPPAMFPLMTSEQQNKTKRHRVRQMRWWGITSNARFIYALDRGGNSDSLSCQNPVPKLLQPAPVHYRLQSTPYTRALIGVANASSTTGCSLVVKYSPKYHQSANLLRTLSCQGRIVRAWWPLYTYGLGIIQLIRVLHEILLLCLHYFGHKVPYMVDRPIPHHY